jgi:glycosyltransferase involved in cell wall biosynthesis
MQNVMIQAAVPVYRQDIVAGLAQRCGGDFSLYCGAASFEETLQTDVDLGEHHRQVRNRYLLNRRLLWQHGVLGPGLRAPNVMLELNPRILNVWVTLLLRRLTGRRTALWGHAFPRAGQGSRSERVRRLQRSLASLLVPYTESQAESLRLIHKGKAVMAAPNALYSNTVAGPEEPGRPGTDVLYSGRLHGPKKPQLLLEGFALALPDLPAESRLIYVGDGALRGRLEARARELGFADRVEFHGTVTDVDRLRVLYGRSATSVCPGFVGLSLIQSLWFGRPMIIADREDHAPEIEAAVDGVNAVFFSADDAHDLARALRSMLKATDEWHEARHRISDECRNNYSAEVMTERLFEALTGATGTGAGVG